MVAELSRIEAGAERTFPPLWRLAGQLAVWLALSGVEWFVDPACCDQGHLKMRKILESRGFEVKEVAGRGQVYHFSYDLVPP